MAFKDLSSLFLTPLLSSEALWKRENSTSSSNTKRWFLKVPALNKVLFNIIQLICLGQTQNMLFESAGYVVLSSILALGDVVIEVRPRLKEIT